MAVSATPARVHNTHNATPILLTLICIRSGFTVIPRFRRVVLPLAQYLYQFRQCEASRSRARHELTHHLVELPPPLHFVALHFLVTDERAGTLLGLEHFPDLHLAIGPRHCIRIDGE